jgi:hypothetical protein
MDYFGIHLEGSKKTTKTFVAIIGVSADNEI